MVLFPYQYGHLTVISLLPRKKYALATLGSSRVLKFKRNFIKNSTEKLHLVFPLLGKFLSLNRSTLKHRTRWGLSNYMGKTSKMVLGPNFFFRRGLYISRCLPVETCTDFLVLLIELFGTTPQPDMLRGVAIGR